MSRTPVYRLRVTANLNTFSREGELTVAKRATTVWVMSIQFACPSCRNPIEVDDEWASHNVACPYCRNTVLAPLSSTYSPAGDVPDASVLNAQPPAPTGGRNTVAIVAFVLSCLWIAAFVATMSIMVPPVLDAVGESPTPQQVQHFWQEQATADAPPPWMIAGTVAFLVAAVGWIAGLVCAIIGVSQRRRRGFAIAAFAVLGVGPILFCAGFILGP